MRFLDRRMSSGLFGRCGNAVALLAVLLGGLASCSEIKPVAPAEAPIKDPTQLYMRLTLEDPAVNLSTADGYDTFQLTAIPRDALGNPMLGLPAPTFRLANNSDSINVRVTAAGLLRAVGAAPLPGVNVVVTLTVGPITHADTAQVVVTTLTTPPKLASLSIHPIPPDSAIWAATGQAASVMAILLRFGLGIDNTLPPTRAIDSAGNDMTAGLAFYYTSLDPEIETFDRRTGELKKIFIPNPGLVRRVVRTNAYGIIKADTVTYTVTMPVAADVNLSAASPAFTTVRIAPHGYVVWAMNPGETLTGDTIDITFDDPTTVAESAPEICFLLTVFVSSTSACPQGGNGFVVDNADLDNSVYNDSWMVRVFPEPGVYTYHSVRRPGLTGRVIVTRDLFAN